MAFFHSSFVDNAPGTPRGSERKSPLAFRTISEVATELDVAQHVLRFWETKFSQVRPLQRGGRRRYYRPEEVDLLRRIRSLLYDDGYTIKGVQQLLKEGRGRPVARDAGDGDAAHLVPRDAEVRTSMPRSGPQPAANLALPRLAARVEAAKRREMENVLDDLQSALELLRRALHDQRN